MRILTLTFVAFLLPTLAFGQASVSVTQSATRTAIGVGVAGSMQYFFGLVDWLPKEELARVAVKTGIDPSGQREGTQVTGQVQLDLKVVKALLERWKAWDEDQKAKARANFSP